MIGSHLNLFHFHFVQFIAQSTFLHREICSECNRYVMDIYYYVPLFMRAM